MNAVTSWKTTDGNTCSVYYDTDPESPREWCNLGKIIVPPGNRYLNSEDDLPGLTWFSKEADLKYLRETYAHVFPLFCLDHSGVAFSTGFISSPWGHWDCGQLGWVVVDKDTDLITTEEQAKAIIDCELQQLTQWANGEVYGYILTDPDGNHVDSCWGYYSIDYIKAEHPEIEEAEA